MEKVRTERSRGGHQSAMFRYVSPEERVPAGHPFTAGPGDDGCGLEGSVARTVVVDHACGCPACPFPATPSGLRIGSDRHQYAAIPFAIRNLRSTGKRQREGQCQPDFGYSQRRTHFSRWFQVVTCSFGPPRGYRLRVSYKRRTHSSGLACYSKKRTQFFLLGARGNAT